MNVCIVYLTNNLTAIVRGKNLYWYEDNKRYLFFSEQEDSGEDDIKVAEFCSACVMGIASLEET